MDKKRKQEFLMKEIFPVVSSLIVAFVKFILESQL